MSRWMACILVLLMLWPGAAGAQSPELAKAVRQYTEYSLIGMLDAALPFAEKAAALSESELGASHPDTIDHLTTLARFYGELERCGEAAGILEKLLAISTAKAPPGQANLAKQHLALAKLYKADKRYAEAVSHIRKILAMQENSLGAEDGAIAATLNELAILYRLQDAYAEAAPLAERALAIYEKLHGPEHMYVAVMLNNLALIYHADGNYAAAEPLYRRSLAIREKSQGPDHPRVAQLRTSLAALGQARISPGAGGDGDGTVRARHLGAELVALPPGNGLGHDVSLLAVPNVMRGLRAALDAIHAESPFSAEVLDDLGKAGAITIVYNPDFPKEQFGTLQLAEFQPDFFAASKAGGKTFLVVLGRHVVKLPARELGGVIVHELVGHGVQHLEGRLEGMRQLDAECEAQLYQLSAYQDFHLDKFSRDMVLFRRDLEEVHCADFKRFMGANYRAEMALWDAVDLDVPVILNLFDSYYRGISG
ncbi:MAG: tetratricopeptide repeat protein [Alphaproteobacteria bacterium]|jgi:hypothetical protein|nr:tetratricopeptide repeat protein [Alphaproteobacteria bacterium]